MSWIGELINMSPASELNDKYVNKGIFGIDRSKNQLDQQKKLTEQQIAAQSRLMGINNEYQKQLYDYTYNKNTPQAQMRNLMEAGLNPALIYGIGGQGGATTGAGGATNVQGGTADSPSDVKQANAAEKQAMLNMRAQESQIALNEAQAYKLETEAENIGAKTTTENQARNVLVEELRQRGRSTWLENLERIYKQNDERGKNGERGRSEYNQTYDEMRSISQNSMVDQEVSAGIAETLAKVKNIDANTMLTSEKAKGYWKELLNETIKAEAARKAGNAQEENAISKRIEANAQKLATEWGTGEYTNWKTWKDTATEGVKMILDIAKMAM